MGVDTAAVSRGKHSSCLPRIVCGHVKVPKYPLAKSAQRIDGKCVYVYSVRRSIHDPQVLELNGRLDRLVL
jgi:hypothetical protein